jgi:hypothetical protein
MLLFQEQGNVSIWIQLCAAPSYTTESLGNFGAGT